MAGKGDISSLSLLRTLSNRTAVPQDGHLPIAMAVSLLFLSGGTCTIGTSTSNLAALLIALYPVWNSSALNANVMQPLRHLYVLATVPSVLEVFDSETGAPITSVAKVRIRKSVFEASPYRHGSFQNQQPNTTKDYSDDDFKELVLTTPCLLPTNVAIQSIEASTLRHYSAILEGGSRINEVGGNISINLVRRSDTSNSTSDDAIGDGLCPAIEDVLNAPKITGTRESILVAYISHLPLRHDQSNTLRSSTLPTTNLANVAIISRIISLKGHGSSCTGDTILSSDFVMSLSKHLSHICHPLLVKNNKVSVLRSVVLSELSCAEVADAMFIGNASWIQHALIALGITDPSELSTMLKELDMSVPETNQLRKALQLATVTNLPLDIVNALV